MWGLEGLWPELFLAGAALLAPRRWALSTGLLLYLGGVAWQQERLFLLYAIDERSVAGIAFFVGVTLFTLAWAPLRREAVWALLLQLASYGLLLRSRHLAFSWALMEAAALSGYFFVIAASEKTPSRWEAALRYFFWSVIGSALILMSLAVRLMAKQPLLYPLSSGSMLSDLLLSWGWAIKAGFLPWHGWLMGLYRTLPLGWGVWYSLVPKGALLLNFLAVLPSDSSSGIFPGFLYGLGALSLVGAYALAWRAPRLTEQLFWGSFAQAGYMVLAMVGGGQASGWQFWLVYGPASLVSFWYVERPWRGRMGNAVGLLLLANLAALPPVLGFWVKMALFWEGLQHLAGWARILLIGAAALATIGGFAVYGKVLWQIWHTASPPPPARRRVGYAIGAIGLFGLGLLGLKALESLG
ncbi:MAG: hypothetical protein KatS3mg026_0174 [Bacteroidia bacterium]|nr:MAG: hypothetical protein KatS3mg026_0174 [Bacteroidia bacterium]